MSLDNYLPEGHEPYVDKVSDTLITAYEEMLKPMPAVRFNNWRNLDTMTGGLRPYEFTVFCGATGSGKTTFCACLSLELFEQKVPHFVASVETGHTDFVKRVISAKAKKDWNTGDPVNVEQLKNFQAKYGSMFNTAPFWLSLYDNRVPVETLIADLTYMVKNHGIKVAIIDNLNFFMEVTTAQNSVIEMDRVIHELIIFCKQAPLHLIMIMHPRKTDDDRVTSEFDVKGSSGSVQEAHNVLLWNRPHPQLIQAGTALPSDRELTIKKMRRRGKYVNRTLLMKCVEGVAYEEGAIL